MDVGLVTRFVQNVGNLSVYVSAVDAGPDHGQCRLLALQHGVVHSPELLVRLSLDEGAGHVRVVPTREVLREDVQDYGLAGPQGTAAPLVRVGGLGSAGGYGAVAEAVAAQELDVYLRAQGLARQGFALPEQGAVPADLGLPQDAHDVLAGLLDGVLGPLDVGHLFRGLGAAEGLEELAVGGEGEAAVAQGVGVDDGECRGGGEGGVRPAEFFEEVAYGLGVALRAALHLAGELGDLHLLVGEKLVRGGGLLGAAVLQGGDRQVGLARHAQADHVVRRQETGEVVGVGVVFRRPDHEQVPTIVLHALPSEKTPLIRPTILLPPRTDASVHSYIIGPGCRREPTCEAGCRTPSTRCARPSRPTAATPASSPATRGPAPSASRCSAPARAARCLNWTLPTPLRALYGARCRRCAR